MPASRAPAILPPSRKDQSPSFVGAPKDGALPPAAGGTGGAAGDMPIPGALGDPGSESVGSDEVSVFPDGLFADAAGAGGATVAGTEGVGVAGADGAAVAGVVSVPAAVGGEGAGKGGAASLPHAPVGNNARANPSHADKPGFPSIRR